MSEPPLIGRDATFVPRSVESALAHAHHVAPLASTLGEGRDSARYFTALRKLGARDLVMARCIEPHLDAAAIAEQAGTSLELLGGPDSTWGVYAARSPGLRATVTSSGWQLTGAKPWCSLGEVLSHALITADADDGPRLFAVALRHPSVTAADEPWVPTGLPEVRSTSLRFDNAPALPVGAPGFYLERDGFAWGGIGVAAVWMGGVDRLAAHLRHAATRRPPDQIALMHLGAAEVAVRTCDDVLAAAARAVDGGEASGPAGQQLAAYVRAVAASAAQESLDRFKRALGPAPLTADQEIAGYIADLDLYLRQHHAERDLAALGAQVVQQR